MKEEGEMKLKFTVIFIIFLTFMFSCKRDNGEFPGESADSTDRVSQQDALKTFINNQMEEKHIPGLAACIIKNNGVVWAEGFGFADIANQKADRPADSVGVIVLTNGDDLLLDNILIRLFQEAENM